MIDNQACTLRANSRRFYTLRVGGVPWLWGCNDNCKTATTSSITAQQFAGIFCSFEARKYLHNCCICCACPSSPSPTAKWRDRPGMWPHQQGKCAPKIFLPSAKRQLLQSRRQQQQQQPRQQLLLRQTWSCCRCWPVFYEWPKKLVANYAINVTRRRGAWLCSCVPGSAKDFVQKRGRLHHIIRQTR